MLALGWRRRLRKAKAKKKTLIISRLPLDKRGGKCHSIQQPPRAAACLDTAFPEFLLITAWEIFGGGVCLCFLEINSSPVGRSRGVMALSFGRAPWPVHRGRGLGQVQAG